MNRWPGGTPLVSYGENISIPLDGDTVSIRQNLDLPLWKAQTRSQIFPNLPVQAAHPTTIVKTLERFNVEAIPPEIVNEALLESRALELPDALDLHVGNKLAFQNDMLVWANNDTLTYVDGLRPITQINVRSPVLEIDCLPEVTVLRTHMGVGVLEDANVSTILEGNTMSMARKDRIVAVTRETEVNILDIATGQTTLRHRFPKCSLNAFNRVSWGSANQLFYIDHNTISLLDIRAKIAADSSPASDTEAGSSRSAGTHIVRNSRGQYATAVRDITSHENDIFVLESTGLLWYDARQPSMPLLELQHYMKRNETSWRVDFLDRDARDLLLSGPTVPFNVVLRFGTDRDFPVLRQDPYLMELWPSVCVQSQIARKTDQGFDLYISTPMGGLFKQELAHGSPPESPQLPADEPPKEVANPTSDFQFFTEPQNSISVDMHNLERMMEPNAEQQDSPSSKGNPAYAIYHALGFDGKSDFKEYSNAIWLDSMPAWKEFRQKFVDEITTDMGRQSLHLDPPTVEIAHENVRDLLGNWEEPVVTENVASSFPDASQPTDPLTSDLAFGFTQPEVEARPYLSASQPPVMPNSQPMDILSFSQPLPKKKKMKRKRVRDGFA